jgi:hypothetical protein
MTSLITLPIRLSLELTARAAKLGVDALRAVAGLIERDEADQRVAWPVADEPVAEREPLVAEPIAAEPVAAPIDFDAPSEEELAPAHIDSDPALAYEAGPADDVGAEVHVDAPWDGYDRMRAADIVARLRSADDATRAVVRLYEQQGKARSSVLAATG